MTHLDSFIFPELTEEQRETLLAHALNVLEAQQWMTTRTGRNILHYTLRKKRQHIKMAHYPKGDRIDYDSGAQYFYHCHRENFDREEHGHFHCFMRYKNIPKSIQPTPLPDWDKHIDNPMTHIVAIAMNRYGQPIRLFTVNRWISFETWYDARYVPNFIQNFRFTLEDDPHWQVLDRWVEGMVQLFAPQIAWVSERRDATLARWQKLHPQRNVYEDHELDELSEISIDLAKQIQWITG